MSPPVTHPPGRGTLAAISLLASLITWLASPLVPDLEAQAALVFDKQPTSAEAGATLAAIHVRASPPPVAAVTIRLSVASGPGGLQGDTDRTVFFNNPTAVFSDLSIEDAGNYTLMASASGYASVTSTPFQITPGPPDEEESVIDASPTSIPADGASTSTVTVQLRDEFENDLDTGGDTVTLSASPSTAGTLGPVTDNMDGTYTAIFTAGTTVTTVTISGTVNGEDIDDTATIQLTPAPATRLAFGQQPTSRTAGQTIVPAVTVRAENAGGGLDTGFSGQVTLAVATGPAGGQLLGTTSVTASGGIATFSDLRIEVAGSYSLRATSGSLSAATSNAFQITPAAASGATSEISADPESIPADGTSTSTITVQLRDAFGNPVTGSGDVVQLATTLGELGTVTSAGSGRYTAILTSSTTAGTATVSGTVNGANIVDTASVAFEQVGQPRLVVAVQPSNTPVNQAISPPVVVRVVDGLGSTLTGFTGNVTASLATNPTGGSLSGDPIEPLQNGVATFDDLRIDRAGNGYRLGFSVPGAVGVTSAPFSVTAGSASGSTSTITASPSSIPADGSSTAQIDIQLRDAAGVPLAIGGDDVDLSTTLGVLGPVRDNQNGSYTATLRSSVTPGTATISGTVNGAPISDTATVTFAAGSADVEVEVEVSDETPGAGDEVVYVVTVRNQGPDVATGIEITQALPARLQFVSAVTSQGEYAPASGIWSVGSLVEGARATLTLVVRVLDPTSN